MNRLKDQDFVLIVYDEMHRLPATTFLQLSTLKGKYRMNLTGTPWREDGRHDLVIALHGYPVGVDWNFFLKRGLIQRPEITVHVVRDQTAKFAALDVLLKEEKKTLIFCDGLDLGNKIAHQYQIPFVSGETKTDRLDIIRDHLTVVISRVGDLGVSVKDLARVIEFDFLYGSRTQEAQRIGRLFHAKEAGEHHLLMTVYEYAKYRKRLWGIESKGFQVTIRKSPDVKEDLAYLGTTPSPRTTRIQTAVPAKPTRRPIAQPQATREDTSIPDAVKAGTIPFISDIAEPNEALLLKILGCDYARAHGGLQVREVRAILDHFFVKYPKGQWLKDKLTSLYKQRRIQGRRVSKTVRRYFYEPNL